MASGKARFLLGRAKKEELESLQDKVTKQSLWGSIGRTAGGLLAAGLTGGTVNPLTLALLTGAATYAGGKVGTVGAKKIGKDKGELTEGRFYKSEASSFEKELGAQNITASLTAALTAGIGQKLKLAKAGETATPLSQGAGMDFKGSWVGKGIEKRAIGRELIQKGEASIGTADKTLQVGKGQFITGGDKAGMVLPDGTSIGSGRTSLQRGRFAPGEITSQMEKAGARTGMGTGVETSYLDRVGKVALPEHTIPEVGQRIGDKFGFMSPQEAEKYAQSQGWSFPPNGGNASWQEELGIGKGQYGNK